MGMGSVCHEVIGPEMVSMGGPKAISLIVPNSTMLPLDGPGPTDYPTDRPVGNTQLFPEVFRAAPVPVGT